MNEVQDDYIKIFMPDGTRLALTKSQYDIAKARAERTVNPIMFTDDVLFECPACLHSMIARMPSSGTVRCTSCNQLVIVPSAK